MLLFCKPNSEFIRQVIIPMSRVIEIIASENRINIIYDKEEVVEVAHKTFQKRVETVSILYDSGDDTDKAIRQFYKACANNSGSFFFGNVQKE